MLVNKGIVLYNKHKVIYYEVTTYTLMPGNRCRIGTRTICAFGGTRIK